MSGMVPSSIARARFGAFVDACAEATAPHAPLFQIRA
jgi:hypothetical protein